MHIDTLVMGDFQTNCYCVRPDASAGSCLVIDPGLEPEPLVQFLTNKTIKVEAIILTHGHADHIGGVETLRQYWPDVQVAIHKDDASMLTDPADNLSILAGYMVQARPAEVLLDSEDVYYQAAGLRFKILHTPGHTPGGICLYASEDGVLFSGDTLFAGSVGRTDFPGGNYALLIQMITQKLLVLPDQTRIYPGHGPATTLRNEKKFNPFLI
ncbi:MAG TPA: MBL fold metallo-hydrolase [Anaerohalosphaeraceae bacterium]|nr:MBL fold metallo-hydrolase [Phycisphaerae bacterium]HOK94979.1 MBL fold metallo-hydrolase [Anaerohalosphaeraceae bacterium]HOL31568.1 MBL fold metallo-hydrolase [Anaerohalosphaeraceae bacterium]HOM75995.1 MBL fold metallo-hydrolase [Anaerohalosphaeraceae bacterium]HPC63764.1 MBL fold metallo-hydrolase [Anaerohalosphaeraceae bacterium]